MPQTNFPAPPVFGSGAPTVTGTKGQVYYDTDADNAPYVFNAGAWHAIPGGGGPVAAEDVSYDNSSSTLTATNVQDAFAQMGAGVEDITSGASPVDCDINVGLTRVTSGGTMGVEVVNLRDLPLDGNGVNAATGKQHVVYFQTETNGSDIVRVVLADDGNAVIYDETGVACGYVPYVDMNYAGETAVFTWMYNRWIWNNQSSNNQGGDEVLGFRVPLPSGGTTGQVPVKNSNADGDVSWGGGFSGDKTVMGQTWTFVEGRLVSVT